MSLSKIFVLIAFSLLPPWAIVHGETIVSPDITGDVIWSAEGSPYVLGKFARIEKNSRLRIMQGTIIQNDGTDEASTLIADGVIEIQGSASLPVKIGPSVEIIFSSTSIGSSISDARFFGSGNPAIRIESQDVQISNSRFDENAYGIYVAYGGGMDVIHSEFKGNDVGIFVQGPPIYQVRSFRDAGEFGMGGEGNAFSDSLLRVSSSSFVGSLSRSIQNTDKSREVDARNNWWGGIGGPAAGTTKGVVDVSPWIDFDPFTEIEPIQPSTTTACCSSVLFIPGIQASRLYMKESGLFGESINQLWEPNRNADVDKLGYDDGKSIFNIIVGNVITDIPFKPIYSRLFQSFDLLKNQDVIRDWKAFPYDWRKAPDEVVKNGVVNSGGNLDLVENVKNLASSSLTGMVSLVAHSNGGLIAKSLIMHLAAAGFGHIVDNLVLVGTPEWGTPHALASLLHGYGQEIAGGIVLNQSTAREFAQSIPGTYSLLPTQRFFDAYKHSVVDGRNITSAAALEGFLFASGFEHMPKTLEQPALPLREAFDTAQSLHGILDSFAIPANISVSKLAGWGIDTLTSLSYGKELRCFPSTSQRPNCSEFPAVVPGFDAAGDGTVLAISLNHQSVEGVNSNIKERYIDLSQASDDELQGSSGKIPFDHANILEAKSSIDFVASAITHTESSEDLAYISHEPPSGTAAPLSTRGMPEDNLLISVHSPVVLMVCSAGGLCTGRQRPDNGNEDSLPSYRQEISGSKYFELAGGKYVSVASDGNYDVIIEAVGTGDVFVKIETSRDNRVSLLESFPIIQVSTSTRMTGELKPGAEMPLRIMDIDNDSDGVKDSSIAAYSADDILGFKDELDYSVGQIPKKSPSGIRILHTAKDPEIPESTLDLILEELRQALIFSFRKDLTSLAISLGRIMQLLRQSSHP